MKLSQFKFNVPENLIAKYPSKDRDECRLMILDRKTQTIKHKLFKEVLTIFDDEDVLIVNNTKVFPARMWGNKEKTGAKIEVFLLRELNKELRLWDVLVDPARKIRVGNKLYFGDDDMLVAEVVDNTTSRGRTIRFLFDGDDVDFNKAIEYLGEIIKVTNPRLVFMSKCVIDDATSPFEYIVEAKIYDVKKDRELPLYKGRNKSISAINAEMKEAAVNANPKVLDWLKN